MHTENITPWQHDHVFGQDRKKAGEQRTLFVVLLTAVMMVVEIIAGISFGSMALLADGLHMASHTVALGISLFAYIYSRRQATNDTFSFGTGKINSLAGFGSAVLLAGFALLMVTESIGRLISPVDIEFEQALVVAVVGLAVNGLSAWLLIATPHDHGHDHGQARDVHDHEHGHDHNLRAAYLHVVADALTSILAIAALLAGKYFGANWLDPAMGIVGAILIARWSYGLLVQAGRVLLDHQAAGEIIREVRKAIERDSTDRVVDLHVWSIGHGIFSAAITVASGQPASPETYRAKLPDSLNIVHATVEVHECRSH